MQSVSLPRGLQIGSFLTLLSGLCVFAVGAYFFVHFYRGLAAPAAPWRSGRFTPVTYSLHDIAAWNPTVAADFVLAQHVEFTNVMQTGISIVLLTIFGLRRRQKWAWYALLALFLWVG